MTVKHTTQTTKPNDSSKDVSANAWNEDHAITPDTIANMLSDHNKAAHDALGIDADTLDGIHAASKQDALGFTPEDAVNKVISISGSSTDAQYPSAKLLYDQLAGKQASGSYAPALGVDDNYVTDAEKIVLGNTSGTNTGDNATNTQYSGLAASKQDALGFTPEDVANKSTSVITDGASDTKYPSVKSVKDYADGLVAGLLDYRGAYDASVNTYPASGGSGSAGAILKGDIWVISVAGTLSGKAIQVGNSIIANADTPGQIEANWDKLNTNITYTPEDAANKVTSISGISTDTQYPSAKLLYDQLAGKQASGSYAPALGVDDNYVTDAEKIVIGNTSGTNTGDNATNTQYSGLAASKQDALGFTPEDAVNKVISISGSSTDAQYPSAKLLYDQLAGKQASGSYAPALGVDDNYVTDAEKIVIGNTSGTNTGDASGHSGLVPASRTVNSKALSADITLGLASADFVNQGTTTTVLHGNAAGNPAFGAIATNDIAAAAVTYTKIQNVSATDKLLGRSTAGAGSVEEIACTAAGRALLDDVDAAAQRTTLGLNNNNEVLNYLKGIVGTIPYAWNVNPANIPYITDEDNTTTAGSGTVAGSSNNKYIVFDLGAAYNIQRIELNIGVMTAGGMTVSYGLDAPAYNGPQDITNMTLFPQAFAIGNYIYDLPVTSMRYLAIRGNSPAGAATYRVDDFRAFGMPARFNGVKKEIASIWLGAEAAYLPATNPAVFNEVAGATTYAGWSYLAFDDTTVQTAVWRVPLSKYNDGNITVKAFSKPQTTPAGAKTLQYDILTIGLAHDEEFNAAVLTDTGVNISHTLGTTTLSTEVNIASGTIDPANVAQDDILVIGIRRDVASDDLVGNGQLLGILLEFTKV